MPQENLEKFIEFINAINHLAEPIIAMNKKLENQFKPFVKFQKELEDFYVTFAKPIQDIQSLLDIINKNYHLK